MNFDSYLDKGEALHTLSEKLKTLVDRREQKFFTLALSGGETAKEMFEFWGKRYAKKITWRNVKFFWVDECCVAPDNNESNFKLADENFFKPLKISPKNVFRIKGEEPPDCEAKHYSQICLNATTSLTNLPDFDCTILGTCANGHTASIFHHNIPSTKCDSAYVVTENPITKQKRITMTAACILNSHEIFLPVLGTSKANILNRAIAEAKANKITLPISYILRNSVNLTLFTDALAIQISG
jgi:6-phosphogluconolactonase